MPRPNLDCFFTVIAGHAQATAGLALSSALDGFCALGRARRLGRGISMRQFGRPLAGAALVVASVLGAAPAEAREVVAFRGDVSAGTVVVRTAERRLYYVLGDGRAI